LHAPGSVRYFKKKYGILVTPGDILPGDYFPPGFDPGAAATIFSASMSSGRISAGMPMTLSPSSIPENFLEPSQPSEKLIFPLR